jgi:hypothetical protein
MHSSPPCLRRFISADYTKLGSFGTALDFASGVINKMDNSYILRLPEWRRAKEGPVQVGAALLGAASVLRVGAAGLSLAGVAAAAAAAHCLFLRSLTTVPTLAVVSFPPTTANHHLPLSHPPLVHTCGRIAPCLPLQVATLLDAKEVNKQYVFSYTLAKEGEPQRTVYSALAMGNNGR